MTVSSTSRRAKFLGNDSTTEFPFTFKVFVQADLALTRIDADGTETALAPDSDFSLALNADQDNDPGGTITYPLTGDPLADGASLVATGALDETQETDITNMGRFLPQVFENALDKLTILIQQLGERVNRALLVSVADSGTLPTLPAAEDRAGYFVGFDAEGDPIALSGTGSDAALRTDLAAATGSLLVAFRSSGTGAVIRTLFATLMDMPISVKNFGAVGDGVTDDSAAFTAAITYANALAFAATGTGLPIGRRRVSVPGGDYQIDTGLSLTQLRCEFVGEGRAVTRIRLASGVYFITVSGVIRQTRISGISFSGGAGHLRHTYTGTNVQGHVDIVDNNFNDYTVCAIGSLSPDFPYLKVKGNLFYGSTGLTSKGVAWAGYTDLCEISSNSFLLNRYHVKLGRGGNNAKIHDNDFIRFVNGGGAPALTDIWVVPETIGVNAGAGLVCADNKFGNENQNLADHRVLFADENVGADFIAKNHTTAASTGYITGHTYSGGVVNGISNMTKGFIYSYTPNVKSIKGQINWGTKYPYFIEVDSGVTITDDRVNTMSTVDYSQVLDASESLTPPWSNVPSLGQAIDPFNYLAGQDDAFNPQPAGSDGGYVNLNGASMHAGGMTLALCSRVDVVDAVGDNNAAQITYTDTTGTCLGGTVSAEAGRLVWAEIDLKVGSSLALEYCRLDIFSGSNPTPVFRRYIKVPDVWKTLRFSFVPNETNTFSFQIKPGDYSAGVRTKLRFGRAKLYNASEPVNPGSVYKQARASWTPGAVATGAKVSTTIAVAGAALGDVAVASLSVSLGGMSISAEAQTDSVIVTLTNNSGGLVTLGAGTVFARAFKQ